MNRNKVMYAFVAIAIVVMFILSSMPTDHDGSTELRYATNSSRSIVLLHTSDIHGHLDDKRVDISTVSGLVKSNSANSTVFLFDTGDTFYENDLLLNSEENPMPDIMNRLGYDAMVPGNHDFYYGADALIELVNKFGSDKVLAMNVIDKRTGKNIFGNDGYKVIEKDGVRIGVFGICSQDFSERVRPDFNDVVKVTNPITASKAAVGKLKALGVDYIVALGHVGLTSTVKGYTMTSDRICSKVSGIDIWLDGHSHTVMSNGKPLSSKIRMTHSDTVIANPGCYMQNISKVEIFNGRINATLVKNNVDDRDFDNYISSLRSEKNSYNSNHVVSVAPHEISDNGNGRRETAMGNLVADTVRSVTGADVTILMSSSVSGSISKGNITPGSISKAVGYHDNLVSVVKMSGEDIRDMISKSLKSKSVPLISGMTVEYDSDTMKVISIKVGSDDIDLNEVYLVAGSEYNFRKAGVHIERYHDTFLHEFIEEFGKMEKVVSTTDGRIKAV